MNATDHQWPYWSVDLPGLTEDGARQILAFAADRHLALGGTPINPDEAFSAHIYLDTASALIGALEAAVTGGTLSAEHAGIVHGFLDLLMDWADR